MSEFKLTHDHLNGLLASLNKELRHNHVEPMVGHMETEHGQLLRGGFQHRQPTGLIEPSVDIISRAMARISPQQNLEVLDRIERGEYTHINQIVQGLVASNRELHRLITSTTSNLPVRENLEQDAIDLTPRDTPLRNMIPRTVGAGLATQWRTLTSLGGGWGSSDEPNGGSALRVFFAETGAPAEFVSTYSNNSMGYKLMGAYGSVTGFAAASGANFQNQIAVERTNSLRNLMLNEENAIVNGSATSTAAPWGDGANALGFDGMINLIATGKGVPSAQIVAVGGALTFAAIDSMLVSLYKRGAQQPYIIANATELLSIVHLAVQSGQVTMMRILGATDGDTDVNLRVVGYIHPITGERVKIIPSRFLAAGTMLFGCERLPNGNPSLDINVLPQVNLPQLAPNSQVQGYVMQELAPALTAPQVYPWMISVYEVMRMKGAIAFGKLTGLTAV